MSFFKEQMKNVSKHLGISEHPVEIIDSAPIKQVIGFPDYYITKCGDVFSFLNRESPIKLKHKTNYNGYKELTLFRDKKKFRKNVSHLVLETFYGQRPSGYEAAHLDGDRSHNSIHNLKWVTHKENESHKEIHGTRAMGEACGTSRLKESDIPEIRKFHRMIGSKSNIPQIAKRYGVHKDTIRHIIQGKSWKHIK